MPAELSIRLPRDRAAVSAAREAICSSFDGLGRKQSSDLTLVVSELVSNAVVHGRGRITLTLRFDDGHIEGEVIDAGEGFERQMRKRRADDFGGHGLAIVEALCTRWGVHGGTTHVWFELGSRGRPAIASPSA